MVAKSRFYRLGRSAQLARLLNGVVVGVAGTASIQLVGNNTLPAISLIPPANFSGDINGITVTLRAQDTDADSTVTTAHRRPTA